MLQYKLAAITPVTVTLASNKPNTPAEIKYEGNDEAVYQVRSVLESSYGAFGHIIGKHTTPIDLDVAMKSSNLKDFYPRLLKGGDLVKDYDPKIPEGSLT